MSGFSVGSFSFSRSGHRRRGGLAGGLAGGLLGHSHSHSSGHRGRYVQGGHYRQVRRSRGPLGCLGAFVVAALALGGGLLGVVTLLA
ncbi:hypothetical protein [Deinococcus koreensis]|uniref:Uncharacterized protein n=1 Tax=Deinococcus koreensis TaxID=2054903 RepID=A0A2K3V116_9DEIO|nr:hypothetical protein [Deinococcus koreensis]PNY82478.1 hypothetical protein CVO96_14975 [Deinococcus koreensis]